PRPRRGGLLMMIRLSMSSLAGTARTLVAVGSSRLCSMLATILAATPLSGLVEEPALGAGPSGLAAAGAATTGAGVSAGAAGTGAGAGAATGSAAAAGAACGAAPLESAPGL